MSYISKDVELSEFIDSKRISPKKMVVKEVLVNYAKLLKDTILNTYKRFENIIWTNEAITILSHVFWQTMYYSYNIRLAMFLSDRAIILFNEYIELAKSTYSNETDFNINKTDIKLFIYKRTIGPIRITDSKSFGKHKNKNKNKNKNNGVSNNTSIIDHLYRIEHVSIMFRQLITKVFFILIQYYENSASDPMDNIIQYIDYVIKIYIHILYKLALHKNYTIITHDWRLITAILDDFVKVKHNFLCHLNIILNIIKVEYELIYYMTKKYEELHLELASKLSDIIEFIRGELTIEDIVFKEIEEYTAIFEELSNLLTDEQSANSHKLLYYKIQKKNIVRYHSKLKS